MSARNVLLLLALLWPCYPARAADTPAPLDRNGDVLPAGAVARLGTLRFRHGDGVTAVAYSPDGKIIASAGADKVVRLWAADSGKSLQTLSGHKHHVRALAFSGDGKTLASGGLDLTIRLWDVESGKEQRTIVTKPQSPTSLALTPHGKMLASGGYGDSDVRLWDAKTGEAVFKLSNHRGYVEALAFSPDSKLLAMNAPNAVQVFETDLDRKLLDLKAGPNVSALAFSPDGKTLAAGNADTLVLWDATSGKELGRFKGHIGDILCIAFTADS
jgi:WD40 repeat protein